jgi:hypothetical protein
MRGPAKGEARLPSPRFGPFLGPRFSSAAALSAPWDAEDLVRELFPLAVADPPAELLLEAPNLTRLWVPKMPLRRGSQGAAR